MIDKSDLIQVVKFKKVRPNAITPTYAHASDSCADLFIPETIHIGPGDTLIVWTGIALELPFCFEARVRGRSGLASKGIQVHQGTIDNHYTGELGVIMTNTNGISYDIEAGKAIAQLSINPVYQILFQEVTELPETDRGSKGFGSSDGTTRNNT